MSVSLIDGHIDDDMPQEITVDEIKKALECHSSDVEVCKTCPLTNEEWCSCKLSKNALDLINRYEVDIERYKGVIKLLEKDVAEAKAEGFKELAERLRADIVETGREDGIGNSYPILTHTYIDNLVKERVGEDNA